MDLSQDLDFSSIMDKQWLIIPVIGLLVSLFIGNNIYTAKNTEVESIKRRIEEEEKINGLIDEVSAKEDVFFRYQDKFYVLDPEKVMEEVSGAAAQSGITISSFSPLERINADTLLIFPFDLKIKGRYHNIGDFVSRIESVSGVLQVVDFKLSKGEGRSKVGDLQGEVSIRAVFAAGKRRKPRRWDKGENREGRRLRPWKGF